MNVIDEIQARLDALEALVFGGSRGDLTKAGFNRRVSKREAALRENCSTRSIERRVKAGTYPAPDDIINGRWSWWLSTLQAHDHKPPAMAVITKDADVPPASLPASPNSQATIVGVGHLGQQCTVKAELIPGGIPPPAITAALEVMNSGDLDILAKLIDGELIVERARRIARRRDPP